jgi:hypothetical protein
MKHLIKLGKTLHKQKTHKIILFKGWPPTFSQSDPPTPNTYANEVQTARDQITFPLACFLAVARRYWYFEYSWGWTEPNAGVLTYVPDSNPLQLDKTWYPQLLNHLGKPDGPATVSSSGYQYTRTFGHGSTMVTCDVQNWMNSSITGRLSQSRKPSSTPPAAR